MEQVTPLYHLYSSVGCHLCELALQLCQQAGIAEQIAVIDIVDAENSAQLVELYSIRIPVIKRLYDQQELGWPFELEQLQEFINSWN